MNILDTRDLEETRQELQADYDRLKEFVAEAETDEDRASAEEDLKGFEDSEDYEHLQELDSLADEIYNWNDGETLIPADDWVSYCEELCVDLGYISKDFPWWIYIDWERTSDAIAQAYSMTDYQGTTYYYRNM